MERIVSKSPLSHVFVEPGTYNVRILDENVKESDSAFCNVIVENPVEFIDVDFRTDLRYVTTDDVINASLSVGKGNEIWFMVIEFGSCFPVT